MELQDKHESLLAIGGVQASEFKESKNLIFYDIIPGRKMEIKNRVILYYTGNEYATRGIRIIHMSRITPHVYENLFHSYEKSTEFPMKKHGELRKILIVMESVERKVWREWRDNRASQEVY